MAAQGSDTLNSNADARPEAAALFTSPDTSDPRGPKESWGSGMAALASDKPAHPMFEMDSAAVLLATADRRIGVMSEAASLDYGGSSRDLLEQTLSDMARDFVLFLTRLALGQGPSPD